MKTEQIILGSEELQKNTIKVLERLIEDVKNIDNPKTMKYFAESLDVMCDDLLGDDFFGTEGQFDPRGNQSEAKHTLT